ncbi:hypothetical protein [Photobacterium proteolyticum]|nr:hypothetical protein [Photobacterium proteolyticum]
MCDLLKYIWGEFISPFYDVRFRIIFVIFIFASTFGIYYECFSPGGGVDFLSTFTPKSMFSYTVPLLITALMDGILKLFERYDNLSEDEQQRENFLNAIFLSFGMIIVMAIIMAQSLLQNSLVLSSISTVFAIIIWVFVNSANLTSGVRGGYTPTGNKPLSSESLSNGR